MSIQALTEGAIVSGPILPEPVEIMTTVVMGTSVKLKGRGLHSNQVYQPILDASQIAQLTISPKEEPFDGDAQRFRLGIEAQRLGLAYEYDPYFSLSIARIDPLPHQLEAVYEYFMFHDLHTADPYRLDVFGACIKDGGGNVLHRRLFVVRIDKSGLALRQPTIFLDLIPAPKGTFSPTVLTIVPPFELPDRATVEGVLLTEALQPWLEGIKAERERETNIVRAHVEISLNELINRAQIQVGDYQERLGGGDASAGIQGLIAQAEQHVEDLNHRLESRLTQLDMERLCMISDIEFVGRAWVRPHPDRDQPAIAPMVRDEEIERIAVDEAIRYEQARGWVVESVESENKGFDLISRKAHPHDAKTFSQVRFIEVKGRALVGEVGLSANEYKTAQRLGNDYWLYVVFNCGPRPELHPVQDPARLGWKPVVVVEHYHVMPQAILAGETKDERTPEGAEGAKGAP